MFLNYFQKSHMTYDMPTFLLSPTLNDLSPTSELEKSHTINLEWQIFSTCVPALITAGTRSTELRRIPKSRLMEKEFCYWLVMSTIGAVKHSYRMMSRIAWYNFYHAFTTLPHFFFKSLLKALIVNNIFINWYTCTLTHQHSPK